MHLIDVLVGRLTERVKQFGHDKLSVFGIGRELNEQQWRAALRQLVAMGHLAPDSEAFGALKLTETSRGVLKGETAVMLREQTANARASRSKSRRGDLAPRPAGPGQAGDATLLASLRAWRSEIARTRGVPAYVVLHDTTIDGIASRASDHAWAASQHPRDRRQKARTLRRRAAGPGCSRPQSGTILRREGINAGSPQWFTRDAKNRHIACAAGQNGKPHASRARLRRQIVQHRLLRCPEKRTTKEPYCRFPLGRTGRRHLIPLVMGPGMGLVRG